MQATKQTIKKVVKKDWFKKIAKQMEKIENEAWKSW